MAASKTQKPKSKPKPPEPREATPPSESGATRPTTAPRVREGRPPAGLAQFQRVTRLPLAQLCRLIAIGELRFTRQQVESLGQLRPKGAARLHRAYALFRQALNLPAGDVAGAGKWLQSPQRGLGGQTPLDAASTVQGALEVERLIGQLEHGVFA